MGMLSRRSWPALVIVVAAIAAAYWRWAPDWNAWRVHDVVPENRDEADELYESQIRYLTWSSELRTEIARTLLRGELTLWEAAACYRQVDARRSAGLAPGCASHRGDSEEERLCRHVIRFVRVELQRTGQDDGLILQLEAELDARVRRGDLRLSAPSPSVAGRFDLDWR